MLYNYNTVNDFENNACMLCCLPIVVVGIAVVSGGAGVVSNAEMKHKI